MKSFAAKTRDILTREADLLPGTRDSRRAELTGLVMTCGTLTLLGGGSTRLTMRTEHMGTGRHITRLLRREFAVTPGLSIRKAEKLGGKTTFQVMLEGEDAKNVSQALGLSPLGRSIPRHCLKSKRSRDAFLRGVFLGCGILSDPQKEYLLEFIVPDEGMAISLSRYLRMFYSVTAGARARRSIYTVYSKDAESIVRLLSAIGANSAILDLENARILKDARNRANRAANCDSGNITKMIGAAGRQLDAIALIEETIGLDALPDTLREIALERKLHADASLEALGAMLSPPVGKSGVYHRLTRIEALAKSIIAKERKDDP